MCIREVPSTGHEKIPATNSIYEHEQDFAMSDEFATIHPQSIYSAKSEHTTDNRLS
jgi:hypothetical protein